MDQFERLGGHEEQATNEEHVVLCVRIQEQMPDLLEGFLDAVTEEAVRAHIAVCYLCSAEFNALERTIMLVETLPFVEPGHDLSAVVKAAVRERGSRRLFPFRLPWR